MLKLASTFNALFTLKKYWYIGLKCEMSVGKETHGS